MEWRCVRVGDIRVSIRGQCRIRFSCHQLKPIVSGIARNGLEKVLSSRSLTGLNLKIANRQADKQIHAAHALLCG